MTDMKDELAEIDDILFDANWEFCASEVEHQIESHSDTLPEFTRRLAAHLRKIDAVGKDRRVAIMEALEL